LPGRVAIEQGRPKGSELRLGPVCESAKSRIRTTQPGYHAFPRLYGNAIEQAIEFVLEQAIERVHRETSWCVVPLLLLNTRRV
jgi:hypothetical protein